MRRFILTSPPTAQSPVKRGVFYSPPISRKRVYRREFDNPGKGFKIKEFARLKQAEQFAKNLNSLYNDNFVVEQIEVEQITKNKQDEKSN